MSKFVLQGYENEFEVTSFDDLSNDSISYNASDNILNYASESHYGSIDIEPKEIQLKLIPKIDSVDYVIGMVCNDKIYGYGFYPGKELDIKQSYFDYSKNTKVTRTWKMIISKVSYNQSSKIPYITLDGVMQPKITSMRFEGSKVYNIPVSDLSPVGLFLSDMNYTSSSYQEIHVSYTDGAAYSSDIYSLLDIYMTGDNSRIIIDDYGKMKFQGTYEITELRGGVFFPSYTMNSKIKKLRLKFNDIASFTINSITMM